MNTALNHIRIYTTGLSVKTYFLVSVASAGTKMLFKNHRSDKLVGFYSKLLSAEIAVYMLLQHFLVF